jgi:RHS repeat-associated protein
LSQHFLYIERPMFQSSILRTLIAAFVFGCFFASVAYAQSTMYFYESAGLDLIFTSGGSALNCHGVGQITATSQLPGPTRVEFEGVEMLTPPGQSIQGVGGLDADGQVNFAAFGGVGEVAEGFVVVLQHRFCNTNPDCFRDISQGGNDDEVILGLRDSGQICQYVGRPGTWSGGMSVPSSKALGYGLKQTPPKGSGDFTPSPANPAPEQSASSGEPLLCTCVGDPIDTATGNHYQVEQDFKGAENTDLSLTRYYNSMSPNASPFGAGWTSTWHRSLRISSPGSPVIQSIRADGRQDQFSSIDGVHFASDPDVASVLAAIVDPRFINPVGYTLTTPDDTVETYSDRGFLQSVKTRNGLVTTLAYNTAKQLTTITGQFGHVMSFTYDDGNHIASMTAPDGGVYNYTYDTHNNLTSVTYPDHTVRSYAYANPSFPHVMTSLIDENGNPFTSWTYDQQGHTASSQHINGVRSVSVAYNGNQTTITDANGNQRIASFTTQFGLVKPTTQTGAPDPALGGSAFTYDANGYIASRTDFDGNVTIYTHDARGNQTSRTEAANTPLARTITTTWHSTFHLPLSITEPGHTTNFTYDGNGNMLTRTVTAGGQTRTVSYTYNAQGQALTMTDPNGNVTAYAYDAHGNLSSVTNALGQVTKFTSYDAAGRLLSMSDPNGLVTTYTYDPRGRLTSRTAGTELTGLAYDAVGDLTKVTHPDGSFLAYSYDAAHRLTGIKDAQGNSVAYTLDANSNRVKLQAFDAANALNRTRSFAYDNVNRLTKEIGAQNQTTLYGYDPQGNLLNVSDPLSHVTQFAYDGLNRRTQTTDAGGGVTQFAYDPLDRLTSETDPRGLATAYSYDGLDDPTGLISPDSGATSRTFDAAGNVLSVTDARGKTTTYTYDALNRVTKAAYADGTSSAYQYDQGVNGIGHLITMTDPAGTTGFTYDQHGRLLQKTQTANASTKTANPTLTMSYGYDASGRRTSLTYPSGSQVSLKYDADGRIASLAQGTTSLAQNVQYQPFGSVQGWTQGNGASYSRAFDQDGRINTMSMGAVSINLGYDASSRIVAQTETGLAAKTYGYDALDRITSFADGSSGTNYFYDADGNRTINASTNGNTVYTYALGSNRLLSRSGLVNETDQYDADGNLTNDGLHSFTYSARGRMAQATTKGNAVAYGINGLGERISKAGMGVSPSGVNLFMYDSSGHLLGEYDDKGNVIEENVWLGDLPVAVSTGGGGGGNGKGNGGGNANSNNLFFVSPDHLGAPHLIADAKGKKVWSWNHDPFGTTDPIGQGNFALDLRFPGQVHDDETGLSYNIMRDYRPDAGRYVQSDPVGLLAGVNTYVYVSANPLWASDPFGLIPPGADPNCFATGTCRCATAECAAGLPWSPESVPQPANWPLFLCELGSGTGCKVGILPLPIPGKFKLPLLITCEVGTTFLCPLFTEKKQDVSPKPEQCPTTPQGGNALPPNQQR